jgi:hypothetical protein
MHPDSGVEVHPSRRWQQLGFVQKKQDQPVLRPSVVTVFMRQPRQMLCALAHIGRTISHGRRRIPVGFSIELQFEASIAAFHGDQAQQRCELLLVLRGNASHGQERGAAAVRPRSSDVGVRQFDPG